MTLPERSLDHALERVSSSEAVQPNDVYPLAGIYSFGRGLICREPISGADTKYTHLTKLRAGQLVMSKLNAWEGALAVVPDEFAGSYVSSEYPVFNVDCSVASISYLKHIVSWPALWEKLTPRGSMVRRKRTTPEVLLQTCAPLPDLDEQRRIAAKLDTLNEKIAHISTARSHMMRTYTSLAESLLNALASNNVRSANVGDLFELNRSEVSIDPHENYRAVGVRSFGKGIIRYSAVSGGELSKLRYFSLPGNAIVLSNIKAWEGAIALTDEHEEHYVASNRFLSYTPVSEDVNLSYVRHYLLSKRGLEQIGKISPGAADRNRTLGRKSFEKMHLPLPEIGQQRKVSNVLDSAAQRLGQRDDGTHLKSLRSSLLNAAFSGRL